MILSVSILIVAIIVSGVSAWFSVIGLMSLFAGGGVSIAVMGVALEAAKVFTAAWLHKHWNDSGKALKWYLVFATVILMIINAIGIYGFLSKGHLEAGAPIASTENSIKNLERDNQELTVRKTQLNDNLKSNTTKAESNYASRQNSLRAVAQTEVDAAIAKETELNSAIERAQAEIRRAEENLNRNTETRQTVNQERARIRQINVNISNLEKERTANVQEITRRRAKLNSIVDNSLGAADEIQEQAKTVQTSIDEINQKIVANQNTIDDLKKSLLDVSAKLGPVRFLSEAVGWQDPESAVKIIILMIMIAFDPISIALILAFQNTWRKNPKTREWLEDNVQQLEQRNQQLETQFAMTREQLEQQVKIEIADQLISDTAAKAEQLREELISSNVRSLELERRKLETASTIAGLNRQILTRSEHQTILEAQQKQFEDLIVEHGLNRSNETMISAEDLKSLQQSLQTLQTTHAETVETNQTLQTKLVAIETHARNIENQLQDSKAVFETLIADKTQLETLLNKTVEDFETEKLRAETVEKTLTDTLEQLQQLIETNQQNQIAIDTLTTTNDELNQKLSEMSAASDQLQQTVITLETLADEYNTLQKTDADKTANIEQLVGQNSNILQELASYDLTISKLATEIELRDRAIEELKKFSNNVEIVEQLNRTVEQNQIAIERLRVTAAEANEERNEYAELVLKLEADNKKLNENLVTFKETYAAMQRQNNLLNEQIAKNDSSNIVAVKDAEIDKLNAELITALQNIETLRKNAASNALFRRVEELEQVLATISNDASVRNLIPTLTSNDELVDVLKRLIAVEGVDNVVKILRKI